MRTLLRLLVKGEREGRRCEGSLAANREFVRRALRPLPTPSPPLRILLMLREPQAHVVSMYSHCQTAGAVGAVQNRYPAITLGAWVRGWLDDNASLFRFCGYSPRNAQSRALSDSVQDGAELRGRVKGSAGR